MDNVLSNWLISEKNKFSIFICGDYGVGKTYTVKECLDTNKLEVYKLNTNSISDVSSITKEYNRINMELKSLESQADFIELLEKDKGFFIYSVKNI